ncbi:glucose-fructose oxidoreductase domain-containing 1 [Brachionus plicatilis]|uniref:Glucose-fructose oxidoreductase domain-containing 1 n=1 Tax=Brachionus plicatilis TaxID=10195 RepID=A0A3M7SZ17_BRAPC|nr:glucose-fructose oxidoreductase domain-containing 1 [Brachionus plicatilis]
MLPGIGIFGSDPISKVLIEILGHLEFDVHAIWTNISDKETRNLIKSSNLVTNSIDTVLLNKNVQLVFVCCQPNFHSQICTKALGIGKNVICLNPTCSDRVEIEQMIVSARYYPCLLSSICFGGLRYLKEYTSLKNKLNLIGDIKVCNITINCHNIVMARNQMHQSLSNKKFQLDILSEIVDKINLNVSSTSAPGSVNWLSDKDLGAGVLNRYGAAIISMILDMLEGKKVTKVFGCLKTLVDTFPESGNGKNNFTIRKITADDYCTFQLNLEPGSVLINVCINSLAHSKYSHEINVCGSRGVLKWIDSNVYHVNFDNYNLNSAIIDSNNNESTYPDSNNENTVPENDPKSQACEEFLNNYAKIEDTYPELPFLYVRGLYFYLKKVKEKFIEFHNLKSNSKKSATVPFPSENLDNFEHTRLIQTVVKSIYQSSCENRWVPVKY